MYEQTPTFFMKFRKEFRYFILYEELKLREYVENSVCYAFGLHNETHQEHCHIQETHYHLLLEVKDKTKFTRKGFRVPCLYSTYALLLRTASYLQVTGDKIERLDRAVTYNQKGNNVSTNSLKLLRRRLPLVKSRSNVSIQSTELSQVFLDRLKLILDGPHAVLFYKVIDIMIDGYGTINNEFAYFSFDLSASNN